MFKSLTQLILKQKNRLTAPTMKNIKIDDRVHRLLKTQAAALGFKITDLASTYLYAAITTPNSEIIKAALGDLAQATTKADAQAAKKG